MRYEISKGNFIKAFGYKYDKGHMVTYIVIEKCEEKDTLKIIGKTQGQKNGNFVPNMYIGDKEYSPISVNELISYRDEGGWKYFEV